MTTFYYTKDEESLLKELPSDLFSKWEKELTSEDFSDAFETPRQLDYRRGMMDLRDMPQVQELADAVLKGAESGDLKSVDFSRLSQDAMSIFFSTIGASGVSIFIELGLQDVKSEKDIEALASFSQVRHALLKSNKEFFTTNVS